MTLLRLETELIPENTDEGGGGGEDISAIPQLKERFSFNYRYAVHVPLIIFIVFIQQLMKILISRSSKV